MHTQQKPTILEAFEQFLGSSGERYQQQDMGRIISRLRRFLQKEENRSLDLSSLYCLDEYVLASQGDKQRSADLVLWFYDYLEARHGFFFDSELRDVSLIDNPTEWLSRDEYRLQPEKGSALRIRERDLLAIEDLEYR